MISTVGGTLDNLRYFGQLEVLSRTVGTLDKWGCFRQLLVLWTTGGTLVTGDPMMLCDHKVQSNPAMLSYKYK